MTEEQEKRRSFAFCIRGNLHGLNEYISAERSNKYIGAKMKHEDMTAVCFYIGKAERVRPPVWIDYHFYEATKRRDKDNVAGWAHKVIQDALIKRGVIQNDGWSWVEGWTDAFSVDRKRPRIEVRIYELHEGETST